MMSTDKYRQRLRYVKSERERERKKIEKNEIIVALISI